MDLEFVRYEKEKQVAYITLDRQDRLNAIGPEIFRDWTAALTEAENDDDVKVIVFKGAGRAFSAGAENSPACATGACREINREQ